MRTLAQKILSVSVVAIGLLLWSGCVNPKNGSLYEPNMTTKPQPTISGIVPAGSAFAGMDTLVIAGTNFSTTLSENTVLFNTSPAALLTVSTSQIKMVAPLVTSDSIGIRVEVFGSSLFSNTYQYKLKAGIAIFGNLTSGVELATCAFTDNTGNIYTGFSTSSAESGLLKFTPAGVRTAYAPSTAGVISWSDLKMGPGGYVYAARNVRALYRFSPGGGSSAVLWSQIAGSTLSAFDFDQNGNLWVGGNNSSIYRIDQLKVSTAYPFVGVVHSMRVFNGYLYFSARTDAGEKIWRAQITSLGLGTPEIYFDFASVYPSNQALVITFSSDGILYIGTDSPDGLLVVNPDKSFSAPFAAYKGLYTTTTTTGFLSLAWGAADDLYATSPGGALMKVTVRGKKSAPYYGSTL